jgi:hypothetical protein
MTEVEVLNCYLSLVHQKLVLYIKKHFSYKTKNSQPTDVSTERFSIKLNFKGES